MSDYEMTLLTRAEEDKEAAKELIAKVGGETVDEKQLGQKPLAYPVKKERAAYFTLLRFRLDPEAILVLNKELLLSGHVLRHMITTAKAKAPVTAGIIDRAVKAVKTRERASQEEKEPAVSSPVAQIKEEPARPGKPLKKTKAQKAADEKQAKDRQKAIEAELEKILREE